MKKKRDTEYISYLLKLLKKIENGSISVVKQDGVVLNIIAKESQQSKVIV
ncbi:hypothetical protein [Sinanaerobacter chloroacetimidivorans]|uniref:DUF2292 domain-containing protein n=1 Tax=Sinanaerobacter chloroacetimidivorans TaxID=2818044 RepID=A0A8J7W230_9FIRM|nr:hypothetical protein [Sinanaerobacter chloroacetimidivorans]MBR0599472.1 hypothetical protein [Sinanaerobacter chloroacetimidivorans]